jgi:microcystin-dependent protein
MDTFMGFITPFPWNWPPRDWANCQGQQMAVSQYSALFSLLGTSFGGNGQTTFGLPELRGRQIIGFGQSQVTGTNFPFASGSGAEQVTLSTQQVPLAPHTHPATFTPTGDSAAQVRVSTNPNATLVTPVDGSYLAAQRAVGGQLLFAPGTPTPTTTVAIGGVSGGGSGNVTVNANAPSTAFPVSVMNPYLALNFCIALLGIYPSRN